MSVASAISFVLMPSPGFAAIKAAISFVLMPSPGFAAIKAARILPFFVCGLIVNLFTPLRLLCVLLPLLCLAVHCIALRCDAMLHYFRMAALSRSSIRDSCFIISLVVRFDGMNVSVDGVFFASLWALFILLSAASM